MPTSNEFLAQLLKLSIFGVNETVVTFLRVSGKFLKWFFSKTTMRAKRKPISLEGWRNCGFCVNPPTDLALPAFWRFPYERLHKKIEVWKVSENLQKFRSTFFNLLDKNEKKFHSFA